MFHSRHKGVQQASCQIQKDTAVSTLGAKGFSRFLPETKGYSRFHSRHKGVQQLMPDIQGYSRFHSRHEGMQQVPRQVQGYSILGTKW
jgi:hypothetical protein